MSAPRLVTYKWTHYRAIYARELGLWKQGCTGPRTALEIGIAGGGSLQLLRDTGFHNVTGIDSDPSCRAVENFIPDCQVFIGDQGDKNFLLSVARGRGPFGIVIDDGSHFPHLQRRTFETLWPYVAPGGIYFIEDTHTAFFRLWQFRNYRGSIFRFASGLVREMHNHWRGFNLRDAERGLTQDSDVDRVIFYDSVIAVHKRFAPGYTKAVRLGEVDARAVTFFE